MNSEELADLAVDALEEIKGLDIIKLDVSDMTTVTDWMIVASGTSGRHVKALVDNVAEKAKAALAHLPDHAIRTMLIDLADYVVERIN